MRGGQIGRVVSGEPSRARTCDPLIKSQLLYQLSYRPTTEVKIIRSHAAESSKPVRKYILLHVIKRARAPHLNFPRGDSAPVAN